MALNTRALEEQIAQAVDEDRKRVNINSAKLRAASQAVPYDVFKQMVAGANLRPLDKDQNLMFVKSRASKGGSSGSSVPMFGKPVLKSKAELQAEKILQSSLQSMKPAQSFSEFEKNWNLLDMKSSDRLKYICLHSSAEVVKILQSPLDFGLLGSILTSLHDICHLLNVSSSSSSSQIDESLASSSASVSSSSHDSATFNTVFCVLQTISSSKRFAFTFSSLDAKEKQMAADVIDTLRTAFPLYSAELSFTEDGLLSLKQVYS